jgi:hypothetical protein
MEWSLRTVLARRLRGIVGDVTYSSWHPHPASTSLTSGLGLNHLPKRKRKPLVVPLALKCRVRLDYPRTPIKSKVGR